LCAVFIDLRGNSRHPRLLAGEAAPQTSEMLRDWDRVGSSADWAGRLRYRILEKQNHLMIYARIWKKLDSSATTFAFQGFY
jgi:hypothetical protein